MCVHVCICYCCSSVGGGTGGSGIGSGIGSGDMQAVLNSFGCKYCTCVNTKPGALVYFGNCPKYGIIVQSTGSLFKVRNHCSRRCFIFRTSKGVRALIA